MRRSSNTSAFDLDPGDYMLTRDKTGVWLCTPLGDRIRVPVSEGEPDPRPIKEGGTWGYTEEPDGSLSLKPSLNVEGRNAWHGFLTNGMMTSA
jgi:hypothetical protein